MSATTPRSVSAPLPWWRQSARIVVALWVTTSLLLSALGLHLGARTSLPGPSSREALLRNPGEAAALDQGIPPVDTVLILVELPAGYVDSPKFKKDLAELVERLRAIQFGAIGKPLFTSVMTRGATWLEDGDALFLGASGNSVLVRAKSAVPIFEAEATSEQWLSTVQDWSKEHPELSVHYLSAGTADREIFALIHSDLDHSLIYTLPLTFLILVWVFGSLRSALLPIVVALLSLSASLGASSLWSHLVGSISATAHQLVVLLVLAIGVDYSLFLISRVREELTKGVPLFDAITEARRQVGLSIIWSGGTVAVSLAGLLVMNDTILTSMAVVSILAVGVTVVASVYALPSLLVLIPSFVVHRTVGQQSSHPAARWTLVSTRRPVIALLIVLTPLIAVGLMSGKIDLGSTMSRSLLPTSIQTAQAFRVLEREFPDFAQGEVTAVFVGDNLDSAESELALETFVDTLRINERVQGPFEVERSQDGTVARYRFSVPGDGNSPENHALIRELEQTILPNTRGVQGFVGGEIAFVVEESERYLARTPLVIAAILLVSFLLLLLAFRSLAIPIKAIALNLISTAASFGTLVLVFQSGLFPGWNYGVIEGFVPALLFSILFGLSMDYHVLLLGRIQEEVLRGSSTIDAVRIGVQSTYRTITGAALVMASVFLIISTLQLPIMKQLGVGLGVAVLIDAALVRTVLLPASMVLLGRLNWYLPRWLQWLPRVHSP